MRTLLVLFFLVFAHSAACADTLPARFDYDSFREIPVLHEGRLKPLDSFARLMLARFSGRAGLENLSAASWLAEIFFDPAGAALRPVFQIENSTLRQKLGLTDEKTLFSYKALQPGLQKTRTLAQRLLNRQHDNALSPSEEALLDLHENTLVFTQLLRSFSSLLPLEIEIPARYRQYLEKQGRTSFATLLRIEPHVRADLENILQNKGENIDLYSTGEQAIATLAFTLDLLRRGGEKNGLPRLIPTAGGSWAAPWAIFTDAEGSPQTARAMNIWQDMAAAWRSGDEKTWQNATADALVFAQKHGAQSWRLKLEIFYHKARLLQIALLLYALSLAGLAAHIFRPETHSLRAARFGLAGGGIVHGFAIIMRSLILARPPVGTLYESVLFVALICAGAACVFAFKNKNAAAIFTGALSAGFLLAIAPLFEPRSDNLEVLVPVLNTNFWLAIHVLCITTGYGICILCACLAHIQLYKLSNRKKALEEPQHKTLYRLSMTALFLMAIGTALGGIWADQSWGRFWGWDPKENGALLIVLWLIWAQHGRISGYLGHAGFAAALAFLNIIVALAWFGVNLLGTGLHSYGFTSGTALWLGVFCVAEILLIGGLFIKAKKRLKT